MPRWTQSKVVLKSNSYRRGSGALSKSLTVKNVCISLKDTLSQHLCSGNTKHFSNYNGISTRDLDTDSEESCVLILENLICDKERRGGGGSSGDKPPQTVINIFMHAHMHTLGNTIYRNFSWLNLQRKWNVKVEMYLFIYCLPSVVETSTDCLLYIMWMLPYRGLSNLAWWIGFTQYSRKLFSNADKQVQRKVKRSISDLINNKYIHFLKACLLLLWLTFPRSRLIFLPGCNS